MILAILIYTIPLSFCLTERSVRSSSTECSESFQNFNAEYADVRSSPSAGQQHFMNVLSRWALCVSKCP